MSRHYSDPSRESDKYSLPDVEVFYLKKGEEYLSDGERMVPCEAGWYYWFCFPGCMPEGDPMGPFKTDAEAVEAMREEAES